MASSINAHSSLALAAKLHLGIHQPALNPSAKLGVMSCSITIDQIGESTFDLPVNVIELLLFFFNIISFFLVLDFLWNGWDSIGAKRVARWGAG